MRINCINQNTFKSLEVTEFPNGTRYVDWDSTEDTFLHYDIKKPQGIIADLEQCLNDVGYLTTTIKRTIDLVKNTKSFLNEKIFGIMGYGWHAVVFDIGGGRVLKISDENPFEYREYNPKFDIPLLSKVVQFGKLFGYIQQKADNKNVTVDDVEKVINEMKKEGFIPSDDFHKYKRCQVGIYNGKSYLLDSRCAMPNIKLSIITKATDSFIKHFDRTPKKPEPEYELIDETPKFNYTWAEIKNIVKKVLASWETSPKLREQQIFKCLKTIKFIK